VLSILSLDDIVEWMQAEGDEEDLRRCREYRDRWQAKD